MVQYFLSSKVNESFDRFTYIKKNVQSKEREKKLSTLVKYW